MRTAPSFHWPGPRLGAATPQYRGTPRRAAQEASKSLCAVGHSCLALSQVSPVTTEALTLTTIKITTKTHEKLRAPGPFPSTRHGRGVRNVARQSAPRSPALPPLQLHPRVVASAPRVTRNSLACWLLLRLFPKFLSLNFTIHLSHQISCLIYGVLNVGK